MTLTGSGEGQSQVPLEPCVGGLLAGELLHLSVHTGPDVVVTLALYVT